MSTTVTLEIAQATLPELIAKLRTDDQIVILQDSQPVAELRLAAGAKPKPQFGSCKGLLTVLADDDEHLKDFEEYMQ